MKVRLSAVLICALLATLTLAGAASAQSVCEPVPANTVITTIPTLNAYTQIAVDSDRGVVYAWGPGKNVSAIDEATNEVIATIPVTGNAGFGITVDPFHGKVYAVSYMDAVVTVIDEKTNTVTSTITLPGAGDSLAIGVDPYREKVYVGVEQGVSANSAPNTSYYAVIDEKTDTVMKTINVANYPQGIAIDPVRGTVYMTAGPTAPYVVYAIDERTDAVTATISMPNQSSYLTIDPIHGRVYVPNNGFVYPGTPDYAAATVSVIDEATNKVVATIPSGYRTFSLAYDPVNQTLYAANEGFPYVAGSGSLAVIDTKTDTVSATIPLTPFVFGVGVDPVRRNVYVSCNSGSVTVISAGGPVPWGK